MCFMQVEQIKETGYAQKLLYTYDQVGVNAPGKPTMTTFLFLQ